MRKPAHLRLKLLLLLACGVLLAAWVYWELPCPIRRLTGVICPSCGMSRAWLALLRFDVSGAFACHPMFWSIPIFILFMICDFRLFRQPRLNGAVLGGLLAGFAVCWCIRLYCFLSGSLPL